MIYRVQIAAFIGTFTISNLARSEQITLNHVSNPSTQVAINIDGSPTFGGGSDAIVNVVDFKAFDCPPCKSLETKHSAAVREHFKDDSRVRFIYKLGRIRSSNANSIKHGYCANKLDKFWTVGKTSLFASPSASAAQISASMKLTETESADFMQCSTSPEALAYLNQEMASISAVGLKFFPTVFIAGKEFPVDANDPSATSKLIAAINASLGD